MLVARITGDEHAPQAVLAGDHNAQVPEANVIELRLELKAGGGVKQAEKVELVRCSVAWHRCVEEEPLAYIDAAEELPVTLELRLHHPIRCGWREPVEKFVQFL